MQPNPTKISANQVFWMVLITQIVTMALLALRTTIAIAKQDAWMSILLGGLFSVVMSLVIVQAGLQFTDQTIIVSIRNMIGKWATRIVLVPYLAFGMLAVGLNMREFMTFVHLAFFSNTPQSVLVIIFFLVVVYLTYQGGIEGIGRCAQLIGPILVAMIAVDHMLNFNFFNFNQILPVYYDSGWQNILSGSFISTCLFSQTFVLFILIPFVDQPQRVRAGASWAVIFSMVFMTASILTCLMLFGPNLSADMLNPTFEFARFISSMEFIENIDLIVVVVWMMGYFISFSMYLFIISYGMGQWLELKKWKLCIWISSFLIVIASLLPINIHIADIIDRYMGWFAALLISHLLILPAVLWLVGSRRRQQHLSQGTG